MRMYKQLLEELIHEKLNTIVNDKLDTIINDKLDDITGKLNDIFNDKLNDIFTDKLNDIDDMSDVNSIATPEANSNNEPNIENIWKTLPTSLTLPTDKPKNIQNINFDGNSFPIRNFKLDWLVPNAHICIIGKRGSGKSWLCRNIIHNVDNKNQEPKIIIAPTDRFSPFYKNNFKKSIIYHQYNEQILKALLGRQEKSVEFSKINKSYNPRAFLVMDDCLASKGRWRRKYQEINEVLMNGRHYQLMYMLTMQFPLGISPELRTNFDYVFLFADDFVNNQKRMYEHYGGMFPSFSAFKQVFGELTKDYGCMVIVNRGKRETFHDKVFWFKAKNY